MLPQTLKFVRFDLLEPWAHLLLFSFGQSWSSFWLAGQLRVSRLPRVTQRRIELDVKYFPPEAHVLRTYYFHPSLPHQLGL